MGSECEAPCGVLDVMLLGAEAVSVVPKVLVIVEFRGMKGKVLRLQELGAPRVTVLVKIVLLVLV